MKSIWIIAGESSGDAYGAALAKELLARQPGITLSGMGGDKMRAAGVRTMVDSTELGFIGFFEVLRHVPFFYRLLRRLAAVAAAEKPSTVVMIDYPGFNLALAKRLHQLGIRVVWYVSPQVWAWRTGRIWKLARYCQEMLCIFPFEPKYYQPTTLKARFVGHPLLDELRELRENPPPRRNDLLLLLPGSRRQELRRLLPDFLQAACRIHREQPQLTFEIALPRQAILEYAQQIFAETKLPEDAPSFQWSVGNTRRRMAEATAAIAASGTVTVEAALLRLPLVVAYKLNPLSWMLGKMLVKIDTITIANLVCGKTVYTECLQGGCTPQSLGDEVTALLPGGKREEECRQRLDEFNAIMGAAGNAAGNVADVVLGVER